MMMNVTRTALTSTIRKFIKNRQGATMVEYAILLALVLLVAYKALGALGGKVQGTAGSTNDAFNVKHASAKPAEGSVK